LVLLAALLSRLPALLSRLALTTALALLLVFAFLPLALLILAALLAALATLALLILVSHTALLIASIALVGHVECSLGMPRRANGGTRVVVPVKNRLQAVATPSRRFHATAIIGGDFGW
jgi:hypothetical protein